MIDFQLKQFLRVTQRKTLQIWYIDRSAGCLSALVVFPCFSLSLPFWRRTNRVSRSVAATLSSKFANSSKRNKRKEKNKKKKSNTQLLKNKKMDLLGWSNVQRDEDSLPKERVFIRFRLQGRSTEYQVYRRAFEKDLMGRRNRVLDHPLFYLFLRA